MRDRKSRRIRVALHLTLLPVLMIVTHEHRATAQGVDPTPAQQGNTLFRSAEVDWDKHRWEQAISKYRMLVEQFPSHPSAAEAHSKIGEYLSYAAAPEVAITEYEKAIAKAPGTHAAYESKIGIAALKYYLREYQEAHELFLQVLKETDDWSLIKECVYALKHIGRMIELQKVANAKSGLDCGPEAMKAVLTKRRTKVPEKLFSELLSMTGGVTLEQLSETARAAGVKTWGVKLKVDQLSKVPKPFIAHVGNNHYVVITDVRHGKVMYLDPHQGEGYKTKDVFQKIWKGSGLIFAKAVPSKMRPQLLSKAEMATIRGGHHLHGLNLGGPDGNPNSAFRDDPSNNPDPVGCPGLPSLSVNLSNFNLLVRDTDFSYSGRGPSVGLTRVYNADDSTESVFGRSWTFNYNVYLVERPNGMGVDIKREDGKVDFFDSRGDGTFNSPRWVHDRLTKNQDGTYQLEIKRTKLRQLFNTQGKLSRITDRNGNSVTLQYDAGNRLQFVTDAVGRATEFKYHPSGKVSEVIDPLGRKATFTYDGSNNLISTVDMNGNLISFAYNNVSYMESLTTPNGTTQITNGTTPYFDEFTYVVKALTDAENNTTRFDTGSIIAWVDDPRGNRTFYFNDGNGQTTQIEDPLGNKTEFDFGTAKGDLTRITDANGRRTNLSYDAGGNVKTITDRLNNTTTFEYDDRDNLTEATDSLGNKYTYDYDENGNIKAVKDPTNVADPMKGITTLTYDSFGQLKTLTDARQKTTTFTYNSDGNLESERNPHGGETKYTYDPAGRLKTLTDPNRKTFNYTYDGIERLKTITHPDGSETRYDYACCNLKSITDPSGTLTFDYDRANRLKRFTDTRNQVVEYGYDENRNLKSLTYPGGKVVQYEYDAADRMKKVTDWLSNTTIYNYDPAGNLISSVNSNGTLTGYQYDGGNRLLSLVNAKSNGSVIAGYKYAFNGLRYRSDIAVVEAIQSVPTPKNITYAYDDDSRIQTAAGVTFTHDDNGNLITVNGLNPTTYTYDDFNRLTQVTSSGLNTQYQYDPVGNRTIRRVNGTTTQYVVDANAAPAQVLAEISDAEGITSYYVYGLGLISKITATGQSYFYHYDSMGSTVALTNTLGDVVNRYAYDPFGNLSSNSTELTSNHFRYIGRFGVTDEENGLLYMRARYYAPNTGRFTTKDPIGLLGGINMYAYVNNNPVNLIDPSGTQWYAPDEYSQCSVYSPSYSYVGANAKCFCECAMDSEWERYVRKCLVSLYTMGGCSANQAHIFCYAQATSKVGPPSAPNLARLLMCHAICSGVGPKK